LYLTVAQIWLAQRQRFWHGPKPPSSNLGGVTILIWIIYLFRVSKMFFFQRTV
jgi:hypothetical protein